MRLITNTNIETQGAWSIFFKLGNLSIVWFDLYSVPPTFIKYVAITQDDMVVCTNINIEPIFLVA